MTGVSRRAVLAGLLLAPPALAACSPAPATPSGPDPLIALADAARADAALAAAVAAAAPALADRTNPLQDARTRHAAALDAEVARLDPARASASATPTPAPAPAPAGQATLDALRAAVTASGQKAAAVVMTAPAARAGLVASVAAFCTAYAGTLT